MRSFAKFMTEKMESKQFKKQTLKDLSLAAVDSFVIFDQMARNDSKNYHLISSRDNRASLCDLNATRPGNYLSKYLERATSEVKVPKGQIRTLQEYDMGESRNLSDVNQAQFPSPGKFKGSSTFRINQN